MQVRDYIAIVRKRWLVIVLLTLSAAVVSFVFARLQSPVYRSSVRLEVSGDLDYGNTLAIEKRLQQYAQRVRTSRVAAEVDRSLRLDLGEEGVLDRIKVAAVPENLQILVDVDDVAPDRARDIAEAVAQVYVEQHTASEQGKPQERQVVIAPLDVPTDPQLIWPQTRVIVLAAVLLGLVLGLILAFVLEYLDDTLKSPEEVERYLALTTLGIVPLHRPPKELQPTAVGARSLAAR